MNTRNIFVGWVGLILLLICLACSKDKEEAVLQPDFIQTSLSVALSIDGGQEFELYIPDDEPGVTYHWTLQDMLTVIDGQGTKRSIDKEDVEGRMNPVKSMGVTAESKGVNSYTRWLNREITILTPPPTLEYYRTKRYGTKTSIIENLNEAEEDG